MQRTVELEAGSITYTEDGEGPVVVLIHGLLVSGTLWRKVVPDLAQHARVIVPTLPLGSHTTPMKPEADLSSRGQARLIAQLLEALDLHDVTLVGSDTGGALSQIVAAEHPQRLGRLVLTNCDMFENFPPKLFRGLLVAAKVPGALAALGLTLRLRAVRQSPLGYGWLATEPDDEVVRGWVTPGQRPEIRRDVAKVLRGIDAQDTIRAAEQLRTFDRPILLAWGTDDRFFPLAQAERFAAAVPSARIETIPGSRTFTMEDRPEQLAARIAAFIPQPAAI
jgi:pimeloyl-ACP methyl ester carboxylesterase